MDRNKMTENRRHGVTRPRERPLAEDVLEEMDVCRPYTVRELTKELSEHDPSQDTVRNRLEELKDKNEVEKHKHSDRAVTYQRPQS